MPANAELFLNYVNNTRIPLSQATGSVFNTGANASIGLVPAPPNLVFPPNYFLRADGTWAQVDIDSISANTGVTPKVLLNTSIAGAGGITYPTFFAQNSQYNIFDMYFTGVQPNATSPGQSFLMRLVNSGGAGVANNSDIYFYGFFEVSSGGNSTAGGNPAATFFAFSNGDIGAGGYGLSSHMRFFNPFGPNGISAVSTISYVHITSSYVNTAGGVENFWINGMFNSGVEINGFEVGLSAGAGFTAIRAGNIRIVGSV
jgi:hypothetical protein